VTVTLVESSPLSFPVTAVTNEAEPSGGSHRLMVQPLVAVPEPCQGGR
jgi:hypothetical protein